MKKKVYNSNMTNSDTAPVVDRSIQALPQWVQSCDGVKWGLNKVSMVQGTRDKLAFLPLTDDRVVPEGQVTEMGSDLLVYNKGADSGVVRVLVRSLSEDGTENWIDPNKYRPESLMHGVEEAIKFANSGDYIPFDVAFQKAEESDDREDAFDKVEFKVVSQDSLLLHLAALAQLETKVVK